MDLRFAVSFKIMAILMKLSVSVAIGRFWIGVVDSENGTLVNRNFAALEYGNFNFLWVSVS